MSESRGRNGYSYVKKSTSTRWVFKSIPVTPYFISCYAYGYLLYSVHDSLPWLYSDLVA